MKNDKAPQALRILSFVGIVICMLMTSCDDIHQYPDKKIPFVLHLDYDTNMPLYKLVEYNESLRSSVNEDYDVRYIVRVFPDDESREVLYEEVFIKDDITELNNSVTLLLKKGNYKFMVWTDYVVAGTTEDLFYDTRQFESVMLKGDKHIGSNDLRDAFNGAVISEVSNDVTEADVLMWRPMAKFDFVSVDLESFIEYMAALNAQKENENVVAKGEADNKGTGSVSEIVNLSDLTVLFRYHGFMPSSMNLHTNKTRDSQTGVTFTSQVTRLNETEAGMGFDYVFVNETESKITISVEVYDKAGVMVSSFAPIEVPIARSKLTTVKANFLTSQADGGVAVVPEFKGEINYEVE